jgi:uncharacterized RDD family membrane protein YckC
MSGMSETPQTPQDWQRYWQEQGQYESTFATPGTGQMPYGLFGDQRSQPYAGWWSRVAASLVDSLLMFLFACVGGIPVGILAAITGNMRVIYLAYVVGFVISLWFPWRNGSTGQTPGKKMLGIIVIREDTGQLLGGPVGLLRWFVGFVISVVTLGIGGLIDVLWPLWDGQKQTLHDKVVKSVVVQVRQY